MKNFPHQFSDLKKLTKSLEIAKQLIDNGDPLTDEKFGEQLTRKGIYTYRETSLSTDEFLQKENQKLIQNRGYLTVSREIRRFLDLLGFIVVHPDKTAKLTTMGNEILKFPNDQELWKNALSQLRLESTNGEISHPYRILLKLVSTFSGIEIKKLMLALEAENDSDDEFERISNLVNKDIDYIIQLLNITESIADNSVKILPSIAEQLGNIEKIKNKIYLTGHVIITEDGIISSDSYKKEKIKINFVSAQEIAKAPFFKNLPSLYIDPTESNRIREKRTDHHHKDLRDLSFLLEKYGFKFRQNPFDLLAVNNDIVLLYEMKTISNDLSDEMEQSIKGLGQLRAYNYFQLLKKGYENAKKIIVFSQKPSNEIIDFFISENISTIWKNNENFEIFNSTTRMIEIYNPMI
jgi:hypothetical protein